MSEDLLEMNSDEIERIIVDLASRGDLSVLLVEQHVGFSLRASALKRAGLDYWEHLRLAVHSDWDAFLAAETPARLFFASTQGVQSCYDCVFAKDDFLVFGSETTGLPGSFYTRYAEHLFRIPMPGAHARSINLANAVAIVLYEAYRQTRGSV